MVRAGDLIGLILCLTALPVQPSSAQTPAPGFAGVEAGAFEALFNAEARQQGTGSALVEDPCDEADAQLCAAEDPRVRHYDFASAGLATLTVRGGSRLGTLIWQCGRDCRRDDLTRGVSLSLRVLSPDLSVDRAADWVGAAGPAMADGWFWSGRVGRARIDVASDRRAPRIEITLTHVDAPATNKSPETRAVVDAMHASEHVIAGAIRTTDAAEIKRQQYRLYNVMPRLAEDRAFLIHSRCGLALNTLAVLAGDLIGADSPAERIDAVLKAKRWSYVEAALSCERDTRTEPPDAPNLR